MNTTAQAAELPATPLFGGLGPEELPELLTHATRIELGQGKPIFLKGEEADAFFVIVSGSAQVRANGGNENRVLAHVGAGAVLGETSLLLGGQHSASVYTAEPTILLRFANQAFMAVLEQSHHGAMRVLYNIARTLAVRLRAADDHIDEVVKAAAGAAVVKGDLDRLKNIFFTEWR